MLNIYLNQFDFKMHLLKSIWFSKHMLNFFNNIFGVYVAWSSAGNYNVGCKGAVPNIVMALTIMATIMPLMPLFYYTPGVVLASIIISAVLGLIDFPAVFFIRKIDQVDFLACVGASLGIIFISMQMGLLIAVTYLYYHTLFVLFIINCMKLNCFSSKYFYFLSIRSACVFKILLHVTRHHSSLQGKIPGINYYRNIEQYTEATRILHFSFFESMPLFTSPNLPT